MGTFFSSRFGENFDRIPLSEYTSVKERALRERETERASETDDKRQTTNDDDDDDDDDALVKKNGISPANGPDDNRLRTDRARRGDVARGDCAVAERARGGRWETNQRGGEEKSAYALFERAEATAGAFARARVVGAEEREGDAGRRERVQRVGGAFGAV